MVGWFVLSMIGTPASNSRRTGCASSDSTAPVVTLLVIHLQRNPPIAQMAQQRRIFRSWIV
jgi:hypothetical protein